METINLQAMGLHELKAFAYDAIAHKEMAERNLAAANQEILIRMNQVTE